MTGDQRPEFVARKLPTNPEALEYLTEASNLRDSLQEALRLLREADTSDKNWIARRDEVVAGIEFDHFGGPMPNTGPEITY